MANVCARLAMKHCEILVLDPQLYAEHLDLSWGVESWGFTGTLTYGDQQVALEKIESIYVRQFERPFEAKKAQAQQNDGDGEKGMAPQNRQDTPSKAINKNGGPNPEVLHKFLEVIPALVVNRPSASRTNGSKPYQAQIIAQHGFHVPKTLITNIPQQVESFYHECEGRVIYKSISHQRSIVKQVTQEDLARSGQVTCCPTQFQECVQGVDVRVHTIGNRVFASEILTGAKDYRYAGREGADRVIRAVEIPSSLEERCFNLANSLGLAISGIDLRRTPDGEYYCFEVNPSPAFNFYESHTGQRIGDAIADLLLQGI